jgi:hypothetical protein
MQLPKYHLRYYCNIEPCRKVYKRRHWLDKHQTKKHFGMTTYMVTAYVKDNIIHYS